MNSLCPTIDRLREFLEEDPGERFPSPMSSHIEHCSACQANLERLTEIDLPILFPSTVKSGPIIVRLKRDLVSAKPDRILPQAHIQFPLPPDSAAPLGRLKQYSILERIAAGAQGVLFKAHDNNLQRLVAIKVLHSELAASPEAFMRFQREARAAAAIDNQHIVHVHEIVCEPGFSPYLVLEYVHGLSLKDRLENDRLEFPEAARIARETASGLAAAHDEGLIHRDIKPSNLLISLGDGPVRIADFGLALDQDDTQQLTREGTLAGTPAYMSPEQVSHPRTIDARTDIYALGVVLYEMLTGEVPFRGSVRMTLMQVVNDEPRLPRTFNDQIPRDLETICLRAMSKERGARFGSAQDMADELLRWENGEPILSRPISRLERRWNWCRRNPLTAALSVLSLVLLLTITLISIAAAISIGRNSAETAKHALAAAEQRNAAIAILQQLVALQAQFDKDEIDLDELQRDSLQIAVDGLKQVRELSRDQNQGGLQSAVALRRMGEILTRLDQSSEARDCLSAAEATARQLVAGTDPAPAAFDELIATYVARDQLEAIAVDSPEQRDWLSEATAIARLRRQEFPRGDSDLRLATRLLNQARIRLADLEDEPLTPIMELLSEAQALFLPWISASSSSIKPTGPDQDPLIGWLESTDLLSQAYLLDDDFKRSRQQIEAGLAQCDLATSSSQLDLRLVRMELAMRFRLAQICRELKERPIEKQEMSRIERLLEALIDGSKRDSKRFADVLKLHETISEDRDDEGDLESMVFFGEQRRRLIETRLAEVPSDEFALLAAAVCWAELAENYWLDGQPKDKIRSAFDKSLTYFRNLAPHVGFEEHDRADFLEVVLAATEFEAESGSPDAETLWQEATALRGQLQPPFESVTPEWLNEIDGQLKTLAPRRQ